MIFGKINKLRILLTILVTIIISCSSTVPSNKPMKQRNKILHLNEKDFLLHPQYKEVYLHK